MMALPASNRLSSSLRWVQRVVDKPMGSRLMLGSLRMLLLLPAGSNRSRRSLSLKRMKRMRVKVRVDCRSSALLASLQSHASYRHVCTLV